MRRSTERILTTHTGSLPRPSDVAEMLRSREEGQPIDQFTLDALIRKAVEEVVAKQCNVGVDVLNDGELGKVAYSVYVKDRLSGFQDKNSPRPSIIEDDFPSTRSEWRESDARS